ncbi:uncharacterized protein LOC111868013 isoform X2 [Cryptotermes secundus]|uniref:uncharacterized protein LOC111868013 isoform X2 n=1 Tax=Cryptotermes secundus TaxID=105785 RepID=UPI000CD7DEF4|nr:uncharacterized protein LOC111868013 isoform X2 [Cryptotermes secundus]
MKLMKIISRNTLLVSSACLSIFTNYVIIILLETKKSEFILYSCYDKSGKFLVKKVVEMSFLRLPFLNVYILVVILTIIAGDHTYYQETSRKGRSVYFENATLQQYGEQTAEMNPLFAKQLNHVESMAEFASLVVRSNRRLCADTTLRILVNLNNGKAAHSDIAPSQDPIEKLKALCVQIKRGRAAALPGLKKREMKAMNAALLEGKGASCKPRAVLVELPAAPSGSSYYPQCVTAKRCGGCCNSALLECRPVNITTVKKWAIELDVLSRSMYKSAKSFQMEQHEDCKCGCKTQPSHCSKAQVYEEDSCQCKCGNEAESSNCVYPKKWDPDQCACLCRHSLPCSTGAHVHQGSCKCI